MANVKRKIVQKAAQWIKSRPNSTDNMTRGPIDRSINVFGIRRGRTSDIPDDLMTRPKPGERGTLGFTKAEKEAARRKKQNKLGVIQGKGTGTATPKGPRGGTSYPPLNLKGAQSTSSATQKFIKKLGIK